MGLHYGPEQTRRNWRNQFWILGGKRKISNVLKLCKHRECRKDQLQTVAQKMPPLPKERMDLQCFDALSIDILGPLEMKICSVCNLASICRSCEKKNQKSAEGVDKCKFKKVFVILFADMVSRAVHLELLQDRTTESILMAFQRMCSSKSTPRYILSDNAGKFVRANKELDEVMKLISSQNARHLLNEKGIRWVYTPPLSPFHYGFMRSS